MNKFSSKAFIGLSCREINSILSKIFGKIDREKVKLCKKMDYEKIKISDQEKYMAFTPLELLEIKTMTDEIIASAEIEGEKLNRIEVENSVMRKILSRAKGQKGF